jgi:hypothetical protein
LIVINLQGELAKVRMIFDGLSENIFKAKEITMVAF